MSVRPARGRCLCLPALCALVLTAAPSAPAQAASEGLGKSELIQQLLPIYKQVRTDPALRARIEQVNLRDRSSVDEWLRVWPISPMDDLEVDMHVRHYEIVIPKFVYEMHLRWLALHPVEGRRLHGDAEVDRATTGLAGGGLAEVPDPGSPATGVSSFVVVTINKNRNVAATFGTTPEDYQGEIQVAVNPHNPNQIVAAANTWDDMGGACGDAGLQAVFYSSNRGLTWGYTCVPGEASYSLSKDCFSDLNGSTFGSDPAVAWDDSGNVFINYMMICANGGYRFAMVVAKSTNGGATWSGQGIVKDAWTTRTLEDKNFYIVDTYPTSPYYGRHYTCWDRSNNEKFAYSINGGANWTEVDLPGGVGTDLGCDIAVGDDGKVYVAFDSLTCTPASCSDEAMYFTKSTDGGATWSPLVQVHDFNMYSFGIPLVNCPPADGSRCVSAFGSIAVDNSGGPCRGTLYVTHGDFPGGQTVTGANVYVQRSTDGGATWGSPVLVNDDASTSSHTQFEPFLVVDRSTRMPVVAWHDTRNDATYHRKVDYYLSRSYDCGASFHSNVKLSSASNEFHNSAISYTDEATADNANRNPNQYGEYLGLSAYGGRAFTAWTDSRHFYPGSTSESQAENLGFAEAVFMEVFLDGFETHDTREWSTKVP